MTALLVFAVLSVLVSSIYGAYLFVNWLKLNGKTHARSIAASVGALAVAIASFTPVAPTYAQSSVSLSFDLTPFFDALNLYLPVFIGVFAIVGGIAGAMALARYVINAVVNAFKGGSL